MFVAQNDVVTVCQSASNGRAVDLSIIVVTNKRSCLEKYLLASLARQSVRCELVIVDNTPPLRKNGKPKRFASAPFTNAPDAICAGIKRATHASLLIVHQDIVFLSDDGLEILAKRIINSCNEIIGVVGVTKEPKYYSSVIHGEHKTPVHGYRLAKEEEKEIFTLDECLFGFKKNILEHISFDPITCNNWHFYAVDLCYQAQLCNFPVIAFGTPIWHVSMGNVTNCYFDTLARMRKKYRKNFSNITSTVINDDMKKPIISFKIDRARLIIKQFPYNFFLRIKASKFHFLADAIKNIYKALSKN